MNTRRSRHDIGMSPKVIMDLMESITELTYTIERGDIKRAHMLCERLDRPIRYMCKTSEYPELFDRYMMKRRKIRHQFDVDENEENDLTKQINSDANSAALHSHRLFAALGLNILWRI